MSLLDVNWNPNRRELKQFALLWVGFFGLIGALSMWAKHSPTHATVWWVVAAVGILGYFLPSILRPIYVTWMAVAMPIGWVVSHLLLLAVYYLVLTPVGLLMRLVGYDPMTRKIDRAAKTYWTPHDPGSEPSRYFKQY